MAALQCEICGGKLMAKSGGLFECEYCGMQYDKTRIQEMVQEIKGTVQGEGTVEVKGTVKVEGQASKENLLQRGRMALEDGQWDTAESCYNKILDMDPQCAEAYLGLAIAKRRYRNKKDYVQLVTNPPPRWLPIQEHDEYWQAADLFRRAESLAEGSLREYLESIRKEGAAQLAAQRQAEAQAEAEAKAREIEKRKKAEEQKTNERMQWERGREIAVGLKGILSISYDHIVCVKQDGTVCAYGKNTHGECDVADWKNIVSVAAGWPFTVGVKADGTTMYAGDYRLASTVRSWKNIQSVKALRTNVRPLVVGLHEDGSVSATHEYVSFYRNGRTSEEKRTDTQDAVKSWHDIAAIACGGHHVLGLKSDGTVLATGKNDEFQCTLYMWENMIAVEGGMYHSVGLKSNGTVVVQGSNHSGECEVDNWKNIVDIAAGPGITVGLRADGTILMAGNTKNYFWARHWENIASITIGGDSVLYGIKADGTIETAGTNERGISLPEDFKLFDDAERFVKERSQKQEEMKRIMEEQRLKEIADKKAALQKEQEQLNAQLPELKGIFAGMQRKKIEARLAEIETELKGLS